MTDELIINDLQLDAIIGVYPHERVTRQPVIISVTCQVDLGPPGRSDALADAIDYTALVNEMRTVVEASDFQLIEALAAALMDALFAADPRIQALTLKLRKPGAIPEADVGIRLTRQRAQ